MRVLTLLFLILVSEGVFAQNKVEIFTTIDGKKFTRTQRDSIENIGNFVGVKEKRENRDTLFYAIFYYDKSYLLTPLQRRFLDKPFPAIDLPSLQGDLIRTEKLKGKISLIMTWDTSYDEEIMVQLNDLCEKYKDSVNFIAISALTEDEVRSALKLFRFSFTLVPGTKVVMEEWEMSAFSFYFLNKEGVTKRVDTGIPVKLKKQESNGVESEEGFKFIVYDYFSEVLDGLLKNSIRK